MILNKLSNLEASYLSRFGRIEAHLSKISKAVESMESSIVTLTRDVTRINDEMKTMKGTINDLEVSLNLAHDQVDQMKEKLDKQNASYKVEIRSLKTETNKLNDKVIHHEVYQRRENLRFFAIPEEGESENCIVFAESRKLYCFCRISKKM